MSCGVPCVCSPPRHDRARIYREPQLLRPNSPAVVRSRGTQLQLQLGVCLLLDKSSYISTLPTRTHPVNIRQVALDGSTLTTELAVTNTGKEAFDFQAALHSYFRCSDINKVGGGAAGRPGGVV